MHSGRVRESEPPTADWPALFDAVAARGGVLSASGRTIGPDEAAFRGMFLDIGEIREALQADGLAPAVVTVCADVLNLPDGFDWTFRRTALVIIARRIQSSGYASFNLDYRSDATASLTVFAEEVDGRFQAIAATAPDGPQPAAFMIDRPPATGGTRIHLQACGPVAAPLRSADELPPHTAPVLEQALRTELTFASLLRDQHPDIAEAMLGWIRSISASLPGIGWMAAELGSGGTRRAGPPRLSAVPRAAAPGLRPVRSNPSRCRW